MGQRCQMIAYRLLKNANLKQNKEQLIKATISDLVTPS